MPYLERKHVRQQCLDREGRVLVPLDDARGGRELGRDRDALLAE